MLINILSTSPVSPFLVSWHTGSAWKEPNMDPASLLLSEHPSDQNEQRVSPQKAGWVRVCLHSPAENSHHAVLAGGDRSHHTGSRSSQTGAWCDQQCWTALLTKFTGPDSPGGEKILGERKQNSKNKCKCKGSLTWAGSCWLMPSSRGTWGSQGPFHHWFCPLQQSLTVSYRFLPAMETVCWSWTRGSLWHLGWGSSLCSSRVCTIILHMSRCLPIAMALSHGDSLTVLPGLLAGS